MPPELEWPKLWQPEAIEAVAAYVDTDYLVEILVGDPSESIHGTLLAGFVYVAADGHLEVIHDRTGRPDVYPWPLLSGPVLRVTVRLPGKRRSVIYANPDWEPPRRSAK